MVAVFTGNGLGLFDSSLAALGATTGGTASLGQGRDRQYVNVAQGNLVLQAADEHLNFRGLSVGLNRTYNSLGQLSDVGADGWLTGFERKISLIGTLNAAGSRARLQQGDGSTTEFQYDTTTGRYVSTAGAGAHDTLSWDAESKTWTLTEGSTRRQELFADHADATAQGRLLKIIAGTTEGGASAAFDVTYTIDGRVAAVVQVDGSANGDAIVFSYDAQGRLASVGTRQAGVIQHQIGYEYDTQGRLTAVVTDLTPHDDSDNLWNTADRAANDGHLFRTEYSYVDATSLKIASVRQSDGVVTRYSYQSDGRLASVAYGEGAQAQAYTLTYATDQRQTDITDAAGRTWSYRFDAAGQLLQILAPPIDGQRDVTSYTYDAAGNLTSTAQTRGSAVLSQLTYVYDANGNVLRQTNQAGENTIRTYSANNQLLSETRYLTGTSNFSSAEPPPAGALRTRYVYDSQDRLRYVVDAEGRVSEYAYAASGTGIGQLASKRSYASTSYSGIVYDEAALQDWAAQLLGDSSLIEYSYDPNGRLTTTTAYAQVDANSVGVRDQSTLITASTYDGQGQLLRTATVRGTADAPVLSNVVDYVYDGMGRLLSVVQSTGGFVAPDPLATPPADSTDPGSSTDPTDPTNHSDPTDPTNPVDPANPTDPVDPPVDPTPTPAPTPLPTRTTTYQYLDSAGRIAIAQSAGATQIQVRDSAGRTTTTTLEDPDSTNKARNQRYFYDAAGLLRASEDAMGGRVYQFYDDKGRLAATVDATGAVVGYSYDGADHLLATTSYANRVTTSGWLTADGVVPATVSQIGLQPDSANDRVSRRSYDAAGRLATETSPVGTVTRYTYDSAGRLLATTVGTGSTARVNRNFYDASGLLTATLDAEGFLIERGYDKAGRLIRTTAYASATATTWRAAGTLDQLRPQASASDQTTRLFYDRRGNLVGQLDPEGYVTEYVFDETGNSRATLSYYKQLDVQAREGDWASIRQQVAAMADQSAYRQQRRQFNGLGQLVTEVSESGLITQHEYDAAGRLIHTVRNEPIHDQWGVHYNTREESHFYNAFGELVAALDGEASYQLSCYLPGAGSDEERKALLAHYATHYEYDPLGRMVRSTDPNGVATWFVYDAAGRVRYSAQGMTSAKGVKNAEAEVTEWRYNAFGDQTEQIRYAGRLQLAVPDSLQSLQDAIGTLAYTAASDARQQLTYNANGQVIAGTDALGVRTLQTYNVFGQLERIERAAGTNRAVATTYAYDRRGLQLQTVQDVGKHRLNLTQKASYDAFGRAVSQTDARGTTTNLVYDNDGRLIQTSRRVEGRDEVTTTRYDAFARAVEMTDASGNTTRLVYDDQQLLVRTTTALGVVTVSSYDGFGELLQVDGAKPGTYQYDENGRLVSWSEGASLANSRSYDDAGRLIASSENGHVVNYVYDDAGRVTASITPFTWFNPDTNQYEVLPSSPTIRYTYDALGRQLRTVDGNGTATEFRYDLDGQLLDSVVDPNGLALRTTYVWDELGRQISITEAAGTTVARTTVYTYDAAGRRIKEVVDPGKLALATSYTYDANGNLVSRQDATGSVTRFAYDEANRLRFQVDGAGDVTETHYDVSGRVTATRGYATRITLDNAPLKMTSTQLQALVVRNDALDRQSYMLLDSDGRVATSIDGAGGTVLYRYDSIGQVLKTTRLATPTLLSQKQRRSLEQGGISGSQLQIEQDAEHDIVQWSLRNAKGQVKATIDASGALTEFYYDKAGRLAGRREYSRTIDLDGQDPDGDPASIRQLLDEGRYSDGSLHIGDLLRRDGAYREVAYVRDQAGRLRYEVKASDVGRGLSVKEYQYSATNELSAEIVHGDTMPYPGDGERWVLAGSVDMTYVENWLERTLSHQSTYYYDAAGRQRFAIDAGGAVTEKKYDAMGRVIETRAYATRLDTTPTTLADVEAAVAADTDYQGTSYRYDVAGRVTVQTDRLGKPESFEYDGVGRVVTHKDRNGAIWNYRYDAAGNKTAQLSPSVSVATVDASGTVVSVQRRVVTRYAYDGQGNVTSMTEDADGGSPRITRYEYDNRGHQIRTIFPDAGRLDANGQLIASGQNATIEITYDALGNAVMQKDVLGKYSYKAYDTQGRLAYEVDAEGYVVSYGYNAFGEQSRLTRHAQQAHIAKDVPDSNPEKIDRYLQSIGSANDRSIYTLYDLAGRKSDVISMGVRYVPMLLAFARAQSTEWGDEIRRDDLKMVYSGTSFLYDVFGNLIKESKLLDNRNGSDSGEFGSGSYAITYHSYDAAGREKLRVDPQGYATTYEYSATGQLTKQVEYAQQTLVEGSAPVPSDKDRTTTYTYDALGRKISETTTRRAQDRFGNAAGTALTNTYAYDAEGRLTQSRINDQIVSMSYDALGRLLGTREATRAVVTATGGALIANGDVTGIDNAKLYQTVSPTTTLRYDAFGNLVEQSSGIDGSSLVTQTFRYDWQGRNVWQRDALGNVLTRTFDAADRVIEERRRADYSAFSHAENGRFAYSWQAAPELGEWAWLSTRFSYDNTGHQLSKQSFRESFANGQSMGEVIEASERVIYNAFGEILNKDTQGAGGEVDQTIYYAYDNNGNVVGSNADGVERTFTYDQANRQISEFHHVGDADWRISHNGANVQTLIELDSLGRVTKRTSRGADYDSSSEVVTQQSYDRWGNQTSVVDANGNETTFEYNDANQLVAQTAPEVKVVSASGVTTAERPVTRWFYDAMGQLVGTRDANGNGRRYTYDPHGRMTSEEDATGGIKRYRDDALGRQVLSSDALGAMTLKQLDAAGRVVSVWADNGNRADGQRSWQQVESYVLDQDGNRLVSIDSTGKVTKASYDSQGRMIRSESATGVVMEYAYDLRGNKILERNALARARHATAVEGRDWKIDRDGQKVFLDEQTWSYDAFNRVTDHNDLSGLDYDYSYDLQSGQLLSASISNQVGGSASGQRVSTQAIQDPDNPRDPGNTGRPPPPPLIQSQRKYYYNVEGLVSRIEEPSAAFDPATGSRRVNTTRYEYDANGNRTLEETTSYDVNNQLLQVATRTSYDAHNRIARVIQDDLVAQRRLLDVRYSYDAVGNRRLVEMGSAFNPAGEQPSNASFENGNRGWNAGEGWVISQRGAGGAATTGTWGAEFKGSNKGPQSITNNKRVAVVAGQTVTASAMVQQGASSAGNASACVLIIWYDAAGNMLTGGEGRSWTSGNVIDGGSHGNWGKSELTTTVPPGAAFMAIAGNANKRVSSNSLWMDDFQWSIGPIPGPPPLNAGLEQGTDNWHLDQGWILGQEGAGGDAYTGSYSAQFNGSNNGPQSIVNSERVAVVPGQEVSASVMVQQGASSAGDASARVLIVWFDANGDMLAGGENLSWSGGNVVDNGSKGRWHQSSVTAKAPPGAAFMSIAASANKLAGGDPLWVDDFQWTYTPVSSGIAELPVDKAYWFDYDKENRATVSNGVLQAGKIVITNDDTSALQSYNADGRVTLRQSYDNGVLKRQQLFYDDQGRVVRIVQTLPDNVTRLLETSHYDTAGRLLERRQYADDGSAKRIDASRYDADGRLISQTAYGIPMGGAYHPVDEDGNPLPMPDDGLEGLQLLSVVNYQDGTPATGYDAAGRLRGYRYSLVRNEQGSGMTTPEGYTHTYRYTYQGAETYLTRQVVGTSTNRDFKTSNSTSTYDAWGKLLSVRETTPGGKVDDRLRYFTLDAEGNILRRTEGTFENGAFTQDDGDKLRTEQYAFANGQYVAAGRFDGRTDVLGQMNAYASTDVGTYKVTVQAGDTLRGLAQRLYGNSNLWYVLADANAIDDDSGLVAGATLNVPDIKANTNDATTFKPFNASEAVGSTTPSLPFIPKPPESGCGTLGMIIMVVVAIVVTIYTAGAAAGAMGAVTASGATAASAGSFAAGVGTLAGSYGATAAVVGGAAGAFAGSVASQAVGSAMGQTSFSWRNVAASTIAGGATAGLGSVIGGAVTSPLLGAMTTAAVGNVSNYAANKLVGNDASFSWRSVAASAVSAGITQQLAPTISNALGINADSYTRDIVSGITGGVVSAHVRQGMVGGAVNYQDVFVDAFGNALSSALGRVPAGAGTADAGRDSYPYPSAGIDGSSGTATIGGSGALTDPDYRADWLYGNGAASNTAGPGAGVVEIEAMQRAVRERSGLLPTHPVDAEGKPAGYYVPQNFDIDDVTGNQLILDTLEYNRGLAAQGLSMPVVLPSVNAPYADWVSANHELQEWLYSKNSSVLNIIDPANAIDAVPWAINEGMQSTRADIKDYTLNAPNEVMAALGAVTYSVVSLAGAVTEGATTGLRLATNTEMRKQAILGAAHAVTHPGETARAAVTVWNNMSGEQQLLTVGSALVAGVGPASRLEGLLRARGTVGVLSLRINSWEDLRVPNSACFTERAANSMNSSNLGLGVEKASPELIDSIASRRTVVFAQEGSEDMAYLDWMQAEANVGGPDYTHILLRDDPSKAAVLEEFLHGTQSRLGIVDRLGPQGFGSAETHVKDFMIRHQSMLGLSSEDVQILRQLRDAGL
ncbi:LysM peptidoglycan-binding domain-containing protein [Xanthomonas oryzae]|uniref:LysM peptidoglycan-binding domain-containing protein n=1 Tax=Xanthomonas oryzae TaxID=347 RepID=UPI001A92E659|nr:LysM peptidoglycan-binding domain-containing protein [Xanthomonas oryzae]